MEQLRLIGQQWGLPCRTLRTISDSGEQDAVAARSEELRGKALIRAIRDGSVAVEGLFLPEAATTLLSQHSPPRRWRQGHAWRGIKVAFAGQARLRRTGGRLWTEPSAAHRPGIHTASRQVPQPSLRWRGGRQRR